MYVANKMAARVLTHELIMAIQVKKNKNFTKKML